MRQRAEASRKPTPGAGTLYELRGGGVIGSALVYQEGVVHMELFRGYAVQPVRFNRLDFRRERLQQHEDEEPNAEPQGEQEGSAERGVSPPD